MKAVPNAHLMTRQGARVLYRADNQFIVGAMLQAQVSTKGSEFSEEAPVSMTITFALQYQVENATRFSDDILAEFARVNGTFNAWPYWREYVDTTAARMNLPPIVLPTFRIGTPIRPSVENGTLQQERLRRISKGDSARNRAEPR